MLGKTHLIFGLFIGSLIISIAEVLFYERIILVLLAVFGSLLCDIDSSSSLLGRKLKMIGWSFKHRGFFHSLIALLLFTLLFYELLGNIYAISFALGFISHLILDGITKEGIKFYPFKFKLKGPIKVGGFLEILFSIISGLFFLYFIF